MKNANELISNNHSVTTSIAIGDVPIITMSFRCCPAENLECGGPAYIPNDLSTIQIYVDQRVFSDSVNINNITQVEFSCFNFTFDITYNKQENYQWEIFDVTENANANKLRNTLISLLQKSSIIPLPQIKYDERLNTFIIYSPNVILK